MVTDSDQRLEDDQPDPLRARRKVAQVKNTVGSIETEGTPYYFICSDCGFESNNHMRCNFCKESILVPK